VAFLTLREPWLSAKFGFNKGFNRGSNRDSNKGSSRGLNHLYLITVRRNNTRPTHAVQLVDHIYRGFPAYCLGK
jgi:hypothetical protein